MSTKHEAAADGVEEEEEIPLEIVDYSCTTPFEEEADAVESFLREVVKKRKKSSPPTAEVYNKVLYSGGDQDEVAGGGDVGEGRGRKLLIEVYYGCQPLDHAVALTFAPLADFVVITHEYDLYTTSDSTILLSILCCGMEKSGCHLPCFVPTGDVHRRTFMGRHHSMEGFCTRYSMQAEKSVPPQCQSVSGLLDLFHLNVGLQSKVPHGHAVLVDSESDYVAPSFTSIDWENHVASENEELSLRCAPSPSFGTREDPIKTYGLTVSWNGVEEKDVVDTTVATTFNPYGPGVPTAVSLKLNLRSSLDYSKEAGNTVDDVLRMLFLGVKNAAEEDDAESCSPSPKRRSTPPDEDVAGTQGVLSALGSSILSDDLHNVAHQKKTNGNNSSRARHADDVETLYPVGSLFSRFAQLCTLTSGVGGGKMRAIESLWSDYVVAGLEREVDRSSVLGSEDSWTKLLGVQSTEDDESTTTTMDHRACLVHQKLQLLKICGETLRRTTTASGATTAGSGGWGGGEGSDDDLFDDEEEDGDGAVQHMSKSPPPKNIETKKTANQGPCKSEVGTPTKIPMIRDPSKFLITPPPLPQAPMCSDQLDEQEAKLTALGTSAAAKTTRLWMQRGSLLSDMAAFKALNGPQVLFADFVHWHSKADFISSELEKRGGSAKTQEEGDYGFGLELVSERMRTPGSLWLSLWESTGAQLGVPHFNAAEEIQVTLAWLRDLPRKNRLLFRQWIAAYTYSNALHRMRQHRLFAAPPLPAVISRQVSASSQTLQSPTHSAQPPELAPLPGLAQRMGRSIGNGLKGLELDWQHLSSSGVESSDHSIATFAEQQEVWELYRSKRRQLESVEVLLCIGISLQQGLSSKDGASGSTGSPLLSAVMQRTSSSCSSGRGGDGAGGGIFSSREEEIEAMVQSLLAQAANDGREDAPTIEGPQSFSLDSLWLNHLSINLLPPSSLFPPYQAPKPLRRRHRIHALVERPMNCPAHEQLLHSSRDEHDTFRVGLALSESLI